MQEKTIRCILCESEFSDAETNARTDCPQCGTTCLPCCIKDDLNLQINKHELHILLVWAENYASYADNLPTSLDNPKHESLRATLKTISKRINSQLTDKILMLSEEIEELNKKGIKADLYRNGKEDINF